jgi:hypothetical protein
MLPSFFESVLQLIVRTSTDLPPDVRAAMKTALGAEPGGSARSHARPGDPANTQLGVAKRVAGDIGYGLGLGPKSATREVAGSAFWPLTRVTPPAIVCWIDRSGVRVARRALAHANNAGSRADRLTRLTFVSFASFVVDVPCCA